MTDHTKGPAEAEGCELYLPTEDTTDGRYHLEMCAELEGRGVSDEQNKADAARLAACWNACFEAGIERPEHLSDLLKEVSSIIPLGGLRLARLVYLVDRVKGK